MPASGDVQGACLCGVVRFRATLPTAYCLHCHCSMCRRNHGAAYVTWIGVPRAQLALDKGAEALVRYASSEHGSRTFCGRCGTALFCESTEHADTIAVPLGVMDGPIDREPQLHIYFDCRAPWATIADSLPRLDEPQS